MLPASAQPSQVRDKSAAHGGSYLARGVPIICLRVLGAFEITS